ncbi:MAG: helix-turn-helix domain-containing protein [Holosporaceae bacterium]
MLKKRGNLFAQGMQRARSFLGSVRFRTPKADVKTHTMPPFRRVRLEKGISLSIAEKAMHLPAKTLEKIELGDWEALEMHPAFLTNILKSYAAFLGVAPQDIQNFLPKATELPKRTFDYQEVEEDLLQKERHEKPSPWALLGCFAFAFLLWCALSFAHYNEQEVWTKSPAVKLMKAKLLSQYPQP